MPNKQCDTCNKEFNDFGHEHITTCMRCNKPEPSEQMKAWQEKAEKIKAFPLTTTSSFANHETLKEMQIITSECVFGMDVFDDILTSFSDFFGGRSKRSQNTLRELRDVCLTELKQEAFDMGADGVVGVRLDYQEFSGKGKSMLFLVASGTAVKFK